MNNSFALKIAEQAEVLQVVNNIKSNAAAFNETTRKMLKLALPFILFPLAHIINFSISRSYFKNNSPTKEAKDHLSQ